MGVETLAVAAIAASVIGTGVSAYGAYQQGQAASTQARYQQQIAVINQQTATRNQALANRNAAYTEAAGARAVDDRARQIRGVIGSQRAAQAANGLIINEGSALDLQEDTAMLGGLAINEVRDDAGRRASGFRIQGLNAQDEARAASARGQAYAAAADSASTAGWLGATSSILTGASNTFGRWSDMQRTGVPMNSVPEIV